MKIGILGSGTVAITLGEAWANKGHAVSIGARNPQKLALTSLIQRNQNVQISTLTEAAAFGDVILLAINPWTEIKPVLELLQNDLEGKVVIDVSNNIDFGEKPELAFSDKSMGEYVQELLPHAHVVKTLNITPAYMMAEPGQSGIQPAIGWVAGNDEGAKQTVATLLTDLGWDGVVDLGGMHASLLQENVGLIMTLVITGLHTQK